MINVKLTLASLHEKFPDLSLDELFAILDAIVEFPEYIPSITPLTTTIPNRWYDTNITCNH